MEKLLRVIITGASGMVGEGVLLECLRTPAVGEVLVLGRRPCGHQHPKLREILHPDFQNITPIQDQLTGYDACYFCLGVSSVGMNEADYTRLTHTLTLHVAGVLVPRNPSMTFCYVSGAGTDSTAHGRQMWARVKGRTENDLLQLPFQRVFAFRPGFMKAVQGQQNTLKPYRYLAWIYPIGRALAPSMFCTLDEVGQAMINATRLGYEKPVLEVRDIVALARRG